MRIWEKINSAFMSSKKKELLEKERLEKLRLESDRKEREKERFVLCIDGGGMRGIIPVVVLQNLEKLLRERGVNKPLSQCFDLIAGTSTGGLIALSLTIPGPVMKDGDVDLKALLDSYLKMGKEIFPQTQVPGLNIVQNILMLASAKYSPSGLEKLLESWFADIELSKSVVPAMIIAYDLTTGRDYVMRSWDENCTVKAREAGRATSAAPTYFPPMRYKTHMLVDGGVIANNPAMFAYAEARKMWPESKKITVLSISTGATYHSMEKNTATGIISWAEHIFPMYSTAQKRSVDYLLNELPDTDYIRLDQSLAEKVNMDETNPQVLKKLVEFGEKICTENSERLENLADRLSANIGEEVTDASETGRV